MGDKFIAILDFAVRNLGKLKSCSLYGSGEGGYVDVATSDGKEISIHFSIKGEDKNEKK